MGPNILSGLDRIRITQTHLFVKNFCIEVALIIKYAYYWMEKHTYATSFIHVNLPTGGILPNSPDFYMFLPYSPDFYMFMSQMCNCTMCVTAKEARCNLNDIPVVF